MLEIEGEVVDLIYKNDITGYTVCNVFNDAEEYVTCVGFLPYISEGESIKVFGSWVTHPDYGKQFKVDTFEKLPPKGSAEIERYLCSGILKGIGPATAKKIVDLFGEQSIEVIRTSPSRLTAIKGINFDKANSISQSLNEQWDLWRVTSFAGEYGIGLKNAAKLYKILGPETIEKLKENPYMIFDFCSGVEFKSVDKMATDTGMDLNSELRAGAGIKYVLSQAASEGHTCLPKNILIEYTSEFLNVNEDVVLSGLTKLIIDRKANVFDTDKIYLNALYLAEKNVAMKILQMSEIENKFKVTVIAKELDNEIVLTEEQEECVTSIFNNQISIITGGPGTGKTTIVKSIIKTLQAFDANVVLCAPTGRAAKRLSESAGLEAKTIHRLLEIKHIDDDDRNAIADINVTPIDADVVIVDEVSMIDVLLMNNLLKAIQPTTMLVLVGDVDQLPSVGPGNVLKDLIDSNKVSTFALTKIFRQAEESMIVVNAHNINEGQLPEFNKKDTDNFLVQARTYDEIINQIISLCTERLPQFKNCSSVDDIQVITPMRKGNLGANSLNKELQNVLNPYGHSKKQIEVAGKILRVTDKVMQIKNNYDIEWENDQDRGIGVFNGDMGKVTFIDNESEIIEVTFDDGKKVSYDSIQLEELDLAYATTVHKSQGSEFRIVVIPVFMGSARLMTRNLLYTAMTRAKELLVFVGTTSSIEYMVRNLNKKERYSGLKNMLIDR